MMKLRKIWALILAVAMIALTGAAFAANTGSSDYDGNTGHDYAQQSDNTFSIKKEVVLFNVDTSAIFEPNVVFSYEVTPVNVTDGDATITGLVLDGNGTDTTSAVVKDGISGAVTIQGRKVNTITGTDGAESTTTGTASTTTTLTFGGDNGTKYATTDEGTAITSSTNTVATGYIDVTVDAATIYAAGKGPGVYRYKISDTTTAATLTAAGVERQSGYVTDLYLDVYVKNNSAGNGYEVYGYVLFKSDSADLDIVYESGTSESVKVDGYTVLSEVTLADQYHTYNVEVTKTITGALADTRNQFPFQVDLANANVTSLDDFYYVATIGGTAGSATTTNLAAAGTWSLGDTSTTPASSALKFQNGDKILITGLPVGTTVTVSEYNNTNDIYTLTAADEADATLTLDSNNTTADSDADSVSLAASKRAVLHAAKDVDYADSKDIVAFTNTIDTISPTGYVARFAPYALMLIGGIALLIVAKKHRRHAEEEDK